MIPGIDGLRAIAILAVLAFHVNGFEFGFGWLGVQFFFVLSGFLITGILLRMKETLPVKQYFYKFYGRRFLRIFPLYYFYLLVLTIALWKSDLIQLQADESISGTLEHWHYDTFLCKWHDPVLGESLIPFISDGQGGVVEFRVKIREDWIDPVEHVFKRRN